LHNGEILNAWHLREPTTPRKKQSASDPFHKPSLFSDGL
jgi:hypothetical protein